jgi:hypothetical protein
MLKEIEKDATALIEGDNLAVQEGLEGQPFTGTGDLRKLICEQIRAPRPESALVVVSAGESSNFTS